MASIRRIPGRKVWIGCFTDSEGRRHQRSTKTRIREKAIKIAEAYEATARKEKTFTEVMATIADLLGMKEEVPVFTLRAVVAQYLERKKSTVSASTYANAERACKVLLDGLGEKADRPMLTLETRDLHLWRDEQLKRVRRNTVRLYQTFVVEIFRKAHSEDTIKRNIASRDLWPPLPKEDTVRTAFEEDQLRALLRVATGEWRGLLLFGLYTGQRLGDLAALTWSNVDTERNLFSFTAQKTGRKMVLPIAPPLCRYIAEELPAPENPKDPLFPESNKAPVKYLSQQFDALLREAGLRSGPRIKSGSRAAKRTRNELSFHSLRHTATTFMSRAGINEDSIMQVVGHESAAVSRGYNHEDVERKRNALNTLPDLVS